MKYCIFFIGACLALSLSGYDRYEIEALEQSLSLKYPILFGRGSGYSAAQVEAMHREIDPTKKSFPDISGEAFRPCAQKLWDAYASDTRLRETTRNQLQALHEAPEPSMLESARILAAIASDISAPMPCDIQSLFETEESILRRLDPFFGWDGIIWGSSERKIAYNKYVNILNTLCVRYKIVPIVLPCPQVGEFGVGSLVGSQVRGELLLPCPSEDHYVHGRDMSPLSFLAHDADHLDGVNDKAYWGFHQKLLKSVIEALCPNDLEERDPLEPKQVESYLEFCCQQQAQMLELLRDFYTYLLRNLAQAQTQAQERSYAGAIVAMFWLIHEEFYIPERNFTLDTFHIEPWGDQSWKEAFMAWSQLLKKKMARNASFSREEAFSEWIGKTWNGLKPEDEAEFAKFALKHLLPSENNARDRIESYSFRDESDAVVIDYTLRRYEQDDEDDEEGLLHRNFFFRKGPAILKLARDYTIPLSAAGVEAQTPDMDAVAPSERMDTLEAYAKGLPQKMGQLGDVLEKEVSLFFGTL